MKQAIKFNWDDEIELVDANYNDYKVVWEIRNSKEVRDKFPNKKPIPLNEHKLFFKKKYKKYKIILYNKIKAGYIRDNGLIEIGIEKKYRSKGIGAKVIKTLKGKTIIMLNNQKSLGCFLKAGFEIRGFYLEK